MGRNFSKWIGIVLMAAATFCVSGLVMSGEAQAARLVNNNDGTVTDTQTGLMWADHDNGSNINWSNAKNYCEGYNGGGKSGWRLPTLDELRSLNSSAYGSVIKRTGFWFWASETKGSYAASYGFGYGARYWTHQSTNSDYRALPVRSGK